jgi:ATP-binding cassette, subfamily B, bacterial
LSRFKPSNWAARSIIKLLNPSRSALLATSGAALLAGLLEGALIASVAQVAASLASDKKTFGILGFEASISTYLWIAAAAALIRLLLGFVLAYLPAQLVSRSQRALRDRLVTALFGADLRTAEAHGGGKAVELVGSHCSSATSALMSITTMISSGVNALALGAFAFVVSPIGSLVLLVVAALLFGVFRPLARRSKGYARQTSRRQIELADSVLELSDLALEVHTHGVQSESVEHIRPTLRSLEHDYFRKDFYFNLVPELYQGIILLGLVVTLAVARTQAGVGLGELGAIVLLLLRTLQYTRQFQSSYQNVINLSAFADRLKDELQVLEQNASPPSGTEPIRGLERLELSQVSFRYADDSECVLDAVSLGLERGKATGLVGRTGAGKSTLVKILSGVLPPSEGVVLLNGRPVSDYDGTSLRSAVAVVPQGHRLYTADLHSNVRFLRSALTDEQIEAAIDLALLTGDPALPREFFDVPLGRRGLNPSGGQAQRISLARAMAGQPTVLMLDEPSSALDERTEILLRDRLLMLKPNMAILLITHRPALLSICDEVFTLREGVLSETREDLLVETGSEWE